MSTINVVVVGNGIAGFSAALTARRLNDRCDITLISKETTPLYSACVLPDYISGKIPREKTFVKTEQDYKQLAIKPLLGHEVKEIDPHVRSVTLDNGKSLPFDKLILSLGSDAIFLGDHKKGIFKLKTLTDADDIKRHTGEKAIVVGSGAIGIEIAIALRHRGFEVTIVEMLEQVLPLALDHSGSRKVKAILEANEIMVFTGERAKETLGEDRIEGLVTDKRELECDTLIWAIGMRPKVELAREAGIEIGEKGGIKVNSHMETNISGIYACGDCVEANDVLTGNPVLSLFWHNANRQGAVAGHNCTGFGTEYPGLQNMLNVDVYGHHVVGFGYTEASLQGSGALQPLYGDRNDLSIIENEKNGSYYRLVIIGDRCIGGQFIDIEKDLGLIWSIMFQGKSIKRLKEIFKNEEVIFRRMWLRRVRPFFENKPI